MPYFILKTLAFEKKLVNKSLFTPSSLHKDQKNRREDQKLPLRWFAANTSSRPLDPPIPKFLTGVALPQSNNLETQPRHPNQKPLSSHRSHSNYFYYWLLEELSFSMNKISLAGLIIGLMVLGSLFFVIGFLAAVATFGTGNTASPTTWASANSAQQGTSSAIGKFAESVGGKLLHDQVIKIESKLSGGALSKVINQVPPSLQPFATQAQNRLAIRAQQQVNSLPGVAAGAFADRTFGSAQRMPPSGQAAGASSQEFARASLPAAPTPPAFAPRQQQQQQGAQPQYRPYPGQPQQQPYIIAPAPPPQQPQRYQQMPPQQQMYK